ncbi:hypothetical protein [Flavobacterium sp. ASW18X]|uniref:hypothetical protein n=1 Tax=Flavobacterium sp. ASW18X TaxID=2572595 RepID=UPI0010AE20F4|nr:hypothetical protein [Flavobacterium sp. ASW18X]TKD60490.1 hypothetical protein FBT53_12855 [Flavobacterium sp. ASW18X]
MINATSLTKIVFNLIVAGVGAVLGGILGFLGLLWSCQWYDATHPPSSPTASMMAVGWVYAFITIPVGVILGIVISLLLYRWIKNRRKKATIK